MAMPKTLAIKLPEALHSRVHACASIAGYPSGAELARDAVRQLCERIEARHGRATRAAKAAATKAAPGTDAAEGERT